MLPMPEPLRIIAVVGATGNATERCLDSARNIGSAITGKAFLLTGGDGSSAPAVKNAVIVGAGADAKIISILPDKGGLDPRGNRITVRTGLENGRNVVNALASDAMIVLEGGAGTLSEAAFAQMTGRCVIIFGGAETKFESAFADDKRWQKIVTQSAVMQSNLRVKCTAEVLKAYAREALVHGLKTSDPNAAVSHGMAAPLRGELPDIKDVNKDEYNAALKKLGR